MGVLFLILGVIVAGAILILAFPQTIEKNFKSEIQTVFNKWVADGNANQTLDFIQIGLKCCGINGQQDYKNTTQIPDSCRNGTVSTGAIYNQGCLAAFAAKIKEVFTDRQWIVGGIGVGVLALLVVGMVLSCCLFCAVRKADKDY